MNLNKNKKAVSAVVATVLIILITIAAVTIIWAAIIPMIQNQLSGSTNCLDPSAHMSLSEDTTCYKNIWYLTCNQSATITGGSLIAGVNINYPYLYAISTTTASIPGLVPANTVCNYTIPGVEVSLGVKRAQGTFDSTGIVAKVFANGKTYSQKISQIIETNTESTIKVANVSYIGVTKVSYAPLIKKIGGTAEEECPNVREVFVKPCA